VGARALALRRPAEEHRPELLALAELRAELSAVCKRFAGPGEEGLLAARAALAQVPLWIARGPVETAARVLGQVQDAAASAPDLHLELRLCRAECLAAMGQVAEAEQVSGDALHQARALGLRLREAQALRLLGVAAALSRRFEQAEAHTSQALEIFEEVGELRDEGHIYCEVGLHRYKAGEHERALEPMERGVEMLRRGGYHRSLAARLPQLASVYHALGDTGACRQAGDEALGLALELSERWLEGRALSVLAEACMAEGDLHEAAPLLDRAAARVRDYGSLLTEVSILGRRADLHARLGEPEQARALWQELVKRCEEAGFDSQAQDFGERLSASRP
jgi:tetratricopeptide (TPR) repeat protein